MNRDLLKGLLLGCGGLIAAILLLIFIVFGALTVGTVWYQGQIYTQPSVAPTPIVPDAVQPDEAVKYFGIELKWFEKWYGAFLAIGALAVVFALMSMIGLGLRLAFGRGGGGGKLVFFGFGGVGVFAVCIILTIGVGGTYALLSPWYQESTTGETYRWVATFAPTRTPLVLQTRTPNPPQSQATTTPGVGEAGTGGGKVVPTVTPPPTLTSPATSKPLPPWMSGAVTHLKIVNLRTKAVLVDAQVGWVDAYCFVGKTKYVAPGEKSPRPNEDCPRNRSGGLLDDQMWYRWDILPFKAGVNRYNSGQTVPIINGHKDSWQDKEGHVFANLAFAGPDTELVLTTTNGEFRFSFVTQKLYDVLDGNLGAEVNGTQFAQYPTGTSLILYTCGGKFQDGAYLQRRMVYWTIQSSK